MVGLALVFPKPYNIQQGLGRKNMGLLSSMVVVLLSRPICVAAPGLWAIMTPGSRALVANNRPTNVEFPYALKR